MTGRYIILADWEARGLHEGRITLLVRPMRKQPTRRDEWKNVLGAGGRCPYGSPGSRLACREAWGIGGARLVEPTLNYRADGTQIPLVRAHLVWYGPDRTVGVSGDDLIHIPNGWLSSATMPRWAIRTYREITEVQARRLQSITALEAIASGIGVTDAIKFAIGLPVSDSAYRKGLGERWDSHHKAGQKFADNIWCWFLTVARARDASPELPTARSARPKSRRRKS